MTSEDKLELLRTVSSILHVDVMQGVIRPDHHQKLEMVVVSRHISCTCIAEKDMKLLQRLFFMRSFLHMCHIMLTDENPCHTTTLQSIAYMFPLPFVLADSGRYCLHNGQNADFVDMLDVPYLNYLESTKFQFPYPDNMHKHSTLLVEACEEYTELRNKWNEVPTKPLWEIMRRVLFEYRCAESQLALLFGIPMLPAESSSYEKEN